MSGRKAGEVSQTPRAVARRKATADKKRAAGRLAAARPRPGNPETPPAGGESPSPQEVSSESIGVTTPPGPPEAKPDDVQDYICGNCRSPVVFGVAHCGVCESGMQWAELTEGVSL